MNRTNFSDRPVAEIYVSEKTESVGRGAICRDGVDIKYRPEVLLKFFFKKPTPKILDLLRIVAAIAHADRRITRRHSVCWGRNLSVNIPVSEPDFWSMAATKLQIVLQLLSGDDWQFKFRKLREDAELPREGYLQFPPSEDLATAYSNGLDSFTVARLVASGAVKLPSSDGSKKNLVLVTTGQKVHLSDAYTQFGYRVRQISVPLTIPRHGKGFQLREISYRTRALVFQTIAAIAAVQSQSNTVVVGEAGQGSLGPWLTVTGEEHPDLRTHPFFTQHLANFLRVALSAEIKYEHPLLWYTKGESLKQLVFAGLHRGWQETHSCAVQARHQNTEGHRLHCGLCPNCLLRRQSLLAAGLDDSDSNYDYGSVSAEADPSTQKRTAQGLMPLIELARVAETPFLTKLLERQVKTLSKNLNLDQTEATDRVNRLVETHKTELKGFINRRSKRSSLRRIGEALL